MTAYVIFVREMTQDQSELERYWATGAASFAGHDVKMLARYGDLDVLEGPAPEGVAMCEFPTMEAARAWYHSPAYQAAAQHRFKGASYRVFIIAGA